MTKKSERRRPRTVAALALILIGAAAQARAPLVLLTDFGTQDGAVSAMKGVAYSVSEDLLVSDLSHENPSVAVGKPLAYINSLLNVAIALNQQNYAAAHNIESGPDWSIELSKN
jgi:S-adenosylmethionine hydrolase